VTDHDKPDETLSFLEEIEHAFRRMIVGIFRFTFIRLPNLVYELFRDFFNLLERIIRYAVKLAIRLIRVLFFAAIWGTLVLGPAASAFLISREYSAAHVIAIFWAGLGLIGSIWGLYRVRRKQLLRQVAIKAAISPDPEALPIPLEAQVPSAESDQKVAREWHGVAAILVPFLLPLLIYWIYSIVTRWNADPPEPARFAPPMNAR
jgi:hypothetical protein